MQPVKTRELATAARMADALVYAAGVAGVVAGGLLFLEGQRGFAVVAWVLTFIAGAMLRLASWGARALGEIIDRTRRMEDDLARIAARPYDAPPGDPYGQGPPDPYRRWGGKH